MTRLFFISVAIFSCLFSQAFAQNSHIQQQPCVNEAFRPLIDSVTKHLNAQGYVSVREASMTMESEYEMPVIAPLSQGTWYYFVFIGDITSKLYEVRMYDFEDRQVFYKKNLWGDVDGNIIAYPYVPRAAGLHMVKPVQVNKKKKKDLCGYIMIFKKVAQGS